MAKRYGKANADGQTGRIEKGRQRENNRGKNITYLFARVQTRPPILDNRAPSRLPTSGRTHRK